MSTTDRGSSLTPRPRPASLVYALLLIVMLWMFFRQSATPAREISLTEFYTQVLARKAVDRIVVQGGERADIHIRHDFFRDPALMRLARAAEPFDSAAGPQFTVGIGSVDAFEQRIAEAEKTFGYPTPIDLRFSSAGGGGWDWLLYALPVLILIALWSSAFRRLGGASGMGGSSIFSFGKSTARLQENDGRSTVTFSDVAGLEEAKSEVKEIVDFLKDPSAYTRLGAKIPKGVIIVGPPGTGKTLLVKAVAGEAQVPFFSISGSEFVEMFVGVGASRVRDLFNRAKEKAPCIVFIDEIDAVGRARGKNALYTGANDERESTLNQLLTEMDGFGTNSGVIVLAATNRADMLDPALLRPGRFDRHIYLELPDVQERTEIFKVHMRPLVTDGQTDAEFLARQTPGFSGADIANICNESALIAARRKHERIGRQDFIDAIDRIVAGLERKSKIISPREKRIIAFHEAGHALASWWLPHVDSLMKVSIIPRGKSLGAAWYLPEERQLHTAAEFRERLCAQLGGRAAEEVVFGEVSTGALDDLEKVTREAYLMVTVYGFDAKLGHVSFYDSTGLRDTSFSKPYSEETARLIDEQVRGIVAEAYRHAKEILTEHRDQLDLLAGLLMQQEVVFREEIESLIGKRVTEEGSPAGG